MSDKERTRCHRLKPAANGWDNVNRWESVLTEAKVMQAVVEASEIRFAARNLEHQLRVLRERGHTGQASCG
jgi:hypothetical protein